MTLENLLEIAKEIKATVKNIEKGNDNRFSARLFFDDGTTIPFTENGIDPNKKLIIQNFNTFIEFYKKYNW